MTEQSKRPWFSFGGKRIEFQEPAPRISAIRMGDLMAHFEEPESRLPHVSLRMIDADNAELVINGIRASAGPLTEATAMIKKIGYGPGDEFEMVHPNGSQLIVRLRTPEDRAAGVSAIARHIPRESGGPDEMKKGRWARPLELDVAAHAVAIDHLAEI
jgi:hypothetical protein